MNLLRFLPRFRRAYRELDALAAREQWSRAEIEAYQLERLNRLWDHARQHVPYYRRLAAKRQLPPRFADLAEYSKQMPTLLRTSVQADPKAFLSERAGRGAWRRTSGSMGTPTRAYWAHDAHHETLRAKYRFQAAWGVDIFDRTVFLWGSAPTLALGLAGLMARVRLPCCDWLRNRLRLSAYRLGPQDLREHLRRIAAYGPALLYGYSTALFLLAREALEVGFRCPSLKLAIATSEPASPPMKETIERGLGVPAAVEYGSVECGFLAGQWPDRTLRVREDIVLFETVPGEDGQYEVLVTPLTNPSFPMFRYRLGDATAAPLDYPERGFAVLPGVIGRDNDWLVARSGRRMHYNRFLAVMDLCDEVARYQVRQAADGSVVVLLDSRRVPPSFDCRALERRLESCLEGYPVRVVCVDEFPQGPAAKHHWIYSELARSDRGPVEAAQ